MNIFRKFDHETVESISMALATELEVVRMEEDGGLERLVGLPSTAKVSRLFVSANSRYIYPIALSPRVNSFQSSQLPSNYAEFARPVVARVSQDNGHLNIVKFLSFQVYNTMKQRLRYHPSSFLPSKGLLTASSTHALKSATRPAQNKRARFLAQVRDGQPFRQVNEECDRVTRERALRTRFEPVVHIDFRNLEAANRNYGYVIENIVFPLLQIFEDYSNPLAYSTLNIYSYEA